MPTYTVEIQAGSDETGWQSLAPAETVTDNGTAYGVACWTGANQTVTDEPDGWRVAVYHGEGAFGHPTATWHPATEWDIDDWDED